MFPSRNSLRRGLLFVTAVCAALMPSQYVSGQEGPCLGVGPDSLHFSRNVCDSLAWQGLDSQFVVIYNCGGGTLEWSISSSEPWVVCQPSSGGNFDSVLVFVDPGSIPPGSDPPPGDTVILEAMLTVDAPGADNSPQYVGVTLLQYCADEGYVLAANPEWFNVTIVTGDSSVVGSLHVYEIGGAPVHFWTYNSWYWLYVDTMSSSPLVTPESLPVTVSATELPPGTYYDSILIMSYDAPTIGVPVVVTVLESSADYVVRASPDYFEFTLSSGDSLLDAGMLVYEDNGFTVPFGVQTTGGNSWLQIHPLDSLNPSWETPDSVHFDVVSSGLAPGYYGDTIIVFYPLDDTVWFEPVLVPVYLTIEGGPGGYTVETDPSWFDLTLEQGESWSDSLHVYEVSGHSVPFTFWNREAWLILDPHLWVVPPAFTPMTLEILIDATALEPGFYVDTIFIDPMRGSDTLWFPPVAVPVFLAVQGSAAEVVRTSPSSFELTVSEGGSIADIGMLVYEEHGHTVVFGAVTSLDGSWLQLHDSVGLTPDSLYFDVDAEGLVPGVYIDSIVIFDLTGDSLWEDVYVHVSLLVEGEPPDFVVETAPSLFDVTLGMGQFVYNSLHIYEVQGRSVPFLYSNSCYWLAVFGQLGPLDFTPTTFTVLIDSDTLSCGTYVDTIFIYPASDSLAFPAVAVPVTMNVVEGYMCGDVDGNYQVDVDDIICVIDFIFKRGFWFIPTACADVNCSGAVDIDDAVYLIDFVFAFGSPPCADCR